MSDDIVERLNAAGSGSRYTPIGVLWNLCDEAADEIERLRNERDEARRVAQKICDFAELSMPLPWLESEVSDE